MIERLLTIAKLDMIRVPVQMMPVNLTELVSEIAFTRLIIRDHGPAFPNLNSPISFNRFIAWPTLVIASLAGRALV